MKFDKPTLVTITAPTCSGKSYLLDHMTKPDKWGYVDALTTGKMYDFTPLFSRIVSTTTRLMRVGEKDGFDYHFITVEESKRMEEAGEFAELIEFNGTRYGVTKEEMNGKMSGELAPIIVLEPQGLAIYEKMCWENGWEVFKIFVNTTESLRIQRLNERSAMDIRNAMVESSHDNKFGYTLAALDAARKQVVAHTKRLLSITGDERNWRQASSWDLLIPGDDVDQAVRDIKVAIKWRNHRNAQLNVNTPMEGAHGF